MSVNSRVVSAFTDDQAAKLTGVTKRQLHHWDRTGFFVPSMAFHDRKVAYSRLYSFRDLASLKVLNDLRNKASVSLPHLREVKERLVHLGDDVWAKTTLSVLNKRVIFDSPDGEGREEVLTGQAVFSIPLRIVSSGVEDAVRAMRQRDKASIGKIERQKNIAHNAAVVAGTRITVESVKAFAKAGYSVDAIRNEYPTLTEDDIRAAIHYGEAA